MTKNIPWIKEFPSDELKEIATFSLSERGAYFTLKLIYHTNPEAFANERMLFAMCFAFEEEERTAVRTVVQRLFKQGDVFPFNERLNALEVKAVIGIDQKRAAGLASGKARKNKRTAVRTISEPEPEPESELKEELKPIKKEKKGDVSPLPEWMPIEYWNGYLEMRIKKNKPASNLAKQQTIHKLDELRKKGHDPSEVLRESIINSWTSVFELKGMNHGKQNSKSLEEYALEGLNLISR